MEAATIEFLSKVGVPIFTFIAGFFVSRYTLSKKERYDIESQKLKLSNEMVSEQDKAFQSFCAALQKYATSPTTGSLDDFFAISTSGEAYFSRLKIMCDAILAGKLDDASVRNTHRPVVIEAINKTLPEFYKTLQEIAIKNKISYKGILKESNYKSVYDVYRSN